VTQTDNASAHPPEGAATSPTRFTWRKTLAFLAIIFVAFLLVTEAVVRLGFFVTDRFSTYYLTFGFVPDIERHSAEADGYSKFQPNSVYHYKSERNVTIDMRINGDGFRSTREFTKPKPPGTFRVVALGESSTFGLANDDQNTYPAMLEARLRARLPGKTVEVFNLGIPHFRSNNILAVARTELPALQPDIVTLYSGYNNSMVLRSYAKPGVLYRAKDWLKYHSVTYRALHPYAATAYQKVSKKLKRDVVGLPHLGLPVELSAARVAQLRAEARAEYRSDLDSIVVAVRRIGATLVPVTQTFTLARLPGVRLEGNRTYLQEYAHVESLLVAKGSIPAPYSTLLIHHDILQEFRDAAKRHNLPLVDGVGVLDREREVVMASFVHLTDEGNRRLSAAIDSTFVVAGVLTPDAAHLATQRQQQPATGVTQPGTKATVKNVPLRPRRTRT
jgi:hypothetical protein